MTILLITSASWLPPASKMVSRYLNWQQFSTSMEPHFTFGRFCCIAFRFSEIAAVIAVLVTCFLCFRKWCPVRVWWVFRSFFAYIFWHTRHTCCFLYPGNKTLLFAGARPLLILIQKSRTYQLSKMFLKRQTYIYTCKYETNEKGFIVRSKNVIETTNKRRTIWVTSMKSEVPLV